MDGILQFKIMTLLCNGAIIKSPLDFIFQSFYHNFMYITHTKFYSCLSRTSDILFFLPQSALCIGIFIENRILSASIYVLRVKKITQNFCLKFKDRCFRV